ncbi:MAG TPA: DNA gyrase modulator, partial [bacterium]|nr:DNA gyrase modulator [bacterium]
MKKTLEKYIDISKKILNFKNVRYAEIRIEEYTSTTIGIIGKEVEDAKTSENLGGSCRILSDYGWGFVSFNNLDNLEEYYKKTFEQSKLVKREKINICYINPIQAHMIMIPDDNPFSYSLTDKFEVCKKYNDLIIANKNIQSSSV